MCMSGIVILYSHVFFVMQQQEVQSPSPPMLRLSYLVKVVSLRKMWIFGME